MADTQGTTDPLDAQLKNQEALRSLMALFSVNDETASVLWGRFIETVKKMRKVAEDQRQSGDGNDAMDRSPKGGEL